MCFSSPKAPSVQSAPPPAPAPVITPSEISPQTNDESRRKRLERLRSGLAGTIKTSTKGISGSGADLVAAGSSGNKTLG